MVGGLLGIAPREEMVDTGTAQMAATGQVRLEGVEEVAEEAGTMPTIFPPASVSFLVVVEAAA